MDKIKILIVEDERIAAEDARISLESLGYSVVAIATSGQAALIKMEEHKPDLVLMDIKLQGKMDGIETADKIRTRFNTPVVYLTAYADKITLERVKQTQPHGYILKPFEDNELQGVIETVLYKYKTEQKLKESEDRYRSLLEATFEAIIIHENNMILDVNPAFKTICGYSRDEAIGMSILEIVLKKYRNIIADKVRTGEEGPYETVGLRKDGKTFHVEVNVKKCLYKGRSAQVVALRDITVRKIMEDSLIKSEEKYRNLIELAPDGILTINTKGVITSYNTAFLNITGYAKDEIIGKHFTKIPSLRKKDLPKYIKLFNSLKREKISKPLEFTWLHKNGSLRIGEAHISFIKEKTRITGFQVIARDITDRKQAEEKVIESELKYKSLVEEAGEGVVTLNLKGKFTFVNNKLTEMIGYSKEELIDKSFADFIHPKDKRKILKTFMTAFMDPDNRPELEFRIIHKKGYSIYIHTKPTPLVFEKKTIGFNAIISDITGRKQSDEALRKSEERFREMADLLPQTVFETDLEGNCKYSNQHGFKSFGYTQDELEKGINVIQLISPEEREKAKQNIMRRLKGEAVKHNEYLALKKDGSTFPALIYSSPIIQDNIPVGLRGVIIDITDRKIAEDAIVQSELFYRQVIENAAGVPFRLIFGPAIDTGHYDFIGDGIQDLLGISPHEFTEKMFHEMVEEVIPLVPGIPTDSIACRNAFIDGDITLYKVDIRTHTKDNNKKWLSDCSIPLKDNKTGKVIGSFGILQDITERKQAEEKITASLKEKEILLKEIHHRVKNNLQIISSLLSLQSGYVKDKQALEMFKESRDRVKSMAFLHEKLYQSPDLAKINFSEYITDVTDSLYRSYGVSPEKITLEVNAEDVNLGVDLAVPCGLIINELFSNALKHAFPPPAEEKGKIDIVIYQIEENTIEIIVKDNGIGIRKELDLEKTESLGLRLVKILVEDQLEGSYKIVRGKGTKFVVQFNSQA